MLREKEMILVRMKCVVFTLIVLLSALILTGVNLTVITATEQETQTEIYQFKADPHKLMEGWEFWVYTAGSITISVEWTRTRQLRLLLYGPGQQDPYVDVPGESPLTKTFAVTSQILSTGQGWSWRTKLGNNSDTAAEGKLTITYPKSLPKINSFKAEPRPQDSLLLLSQDATTLTYAAFPGQQVTFSWNVELGISGITLAWGCGLIAPERAAGAPAEDCPTTSMGITASRGTYGPIPMSDRGNVYTLEAKNKHGTVKATVKILPKVWVGYDQAACIGCAPCQNCSKPSQVSQLATYLGEIEQKCNGGCIRNNSNLDRFNDPYLRGRMTDDLLQAMKNIIIYPDDKNLPSVAPGIKCTTDHGYTPGDKKYVMICLAKGAAGMTLLHELEHYVDPKTTECRAAWVAHSCYGCPNGGIPCPTCSY